MHIKCVTTKSEGKGPLLRSGSTGKDNIKMHMKETGCEGVHWIQVIEGTIELQALVNTKTNFRIP
jgi:hypothetical protein